MTDDNHVALVTFVDPTGTSGQNIYSRSVAKALAEHSDVELSLVCPDPSRQLPEILSEDVSLHFLPSRKRRSLRWQLDVQLPVYHTLQAVQETCPLDGLVTVFRPGMVVPPIFARLHGIPMALLVEGLPARNVRRIIPVPGVGRAVNGVASLNAVNSRCVYTAYEESQEWVRSLPGVPDDRVSVFHHGVDTDQFQPRSKLQARKTVGTVSEDAFVVGFAGSFKPYHELDKLLRAVSTSNRLDSVELLLVGDGPEHDSLESLAVELGIDDRVTFTGFVGHERVSAYISACDALYGVVNPDHWGSPMKVYEYLACARPVIAFENEEFEFVNRIDAGEVVSNTRVDTIAIAIEDFLDRSENERMEMGSAGRRHIIENRTWDALADGLVRCLGDENS